MSIIQRSHDNPWPVWAVLCLGLFMALLSTIVNLTEQAEEAA